MLTFDLFSLHRRSCPICAGKRLCLDGWRLFHDTAQIIAHTPDRKRAQA